MQWLLTCHCPSSRADCGIVLVHPVWNGYVIRWIFKYILYDNWISTRAVGLSSLCSMSSFKVAIETVGILITCRPWSEKDERLVSLRTEILYPYPLCKASGRIPGLSFPNCVVRQSGALQGINIVGVKLPAVRRTAGSSALSRLTVIKVWCKIIRARVDTKHSSYF